jgi:CubicO group peptidase (beta-lactamase class C family)
MTQPGGFSKARLARMHEVMAGYVARDEVPGLVTVVSRRGEAHFDAIGSKTLGGKSPMQRDTIFRISSMTKPVTAVAAMILIEECRIRLDDPVDDLLPELADRKVLRTMESELDDVVPAERSITVRDLLTFRLGFGLVMAEPGTYPIQRAMDELSLGQNGPTWMENPQPDEWIRRLGTLPLMAQPGERWLYNTGADVLGVLIARASGQSLPSFFQERIFDPLGMKDTGFYVPSEKVDRLATGYGTNPETGKTEVFDPAEGGQYTRPPAFPAGSAGLVSTADDLLAFGQMMLNRGSYGRNERLLSRLSVEAMTTNQITPEQKAGMEIVLGEGRGWGLGIGLVTHRNDVSAVPGRFGWEGGLGTSWACDPAEEMVGILLTQKAWDSPSGPKIWSDFWTSAYTAIAD